MELEHLSPDILEKMKACSTVGELLALAEEEGFELSLEQLDKISGGSGGLTVENKTCPKCGYKRAHYVIDKESGQGANRCPRCGNGYRSLPIVSREL